MKLTKMVAVAVLMTLPLTACKSAHQWLNTTNAIKKQEAQIATLQRDVSLLTQQLKRVQKVQAQGELARQCALDAGKWYKTNFSDGLSTPVEGGGHMYTGATGYQAHYSASRNGCFALVHSMFLATRTKTRPSSFIQTTKLYNVYENNEIGVFVVKSFPTQITVCKVLQVVCKTNIEWMTLARPYLEG